MADSKTDNNGIKTLLAVSNADGTTPVTLYADPVTHRLLTSAAASTPTAITVANEATDTTSFPLFVTAATGDLGPKTNAGLTFNSNTANLQSTILSSSSLTASEILITDASKNLVSAAVATYPSLTELTYVKGVTSAIQTQLGTKQATITFGTGVETALGVNVGSAGAPVLFDGALGTPSSGTATNLTGTASGLTAGTVTGFTPASGSLTLSGDDALTLTTSAATNVTLPTTGTLATLAGVEELDNKTLDSSVGKGTWTASGTWTLPAVTLGGAVTLAADMTLNENTSVVLDPALSADGKYCGITETGTGGATIAFGDLLYFDAATSRWKLTDADADATSGAVRIAIAVTSSTDGAAITVLHYGKIRADAAFPALTIGAPAYVGTTAGDIQTAQPSGTDDVIRIVGYGVTADELFFNPSNDYITHT